MYCVAAHLNGNEIKSVNVCSISSSKAFTSSSSSSSSCTRGPSPNSSHTLSDDCMEVKQEYTPSYHPLFCWVWAHCSELNITHEHLNVVRSKARCTAVPVSSGALSPEVTQQPLLIGWFSCVERGWEPSSGADMSDACRLVVYVLVVGIDAATSFVRHAVGRRATASGTQQVPTRRVAYYGIHGDARSFSKSNQHVHSFRMKWKS